MPSTSATTRPLREVPRLLVLTDREQARTAGRSLRPTVLDVAAAGAPAVLVREQDLSRRRRRNLATQLGAVTGGLGTALLVADDPELAAAVGDGVHLAAVDEPVSRQLRDQLLVGRSCHDHAEVEAAVADGVDYVTISPVASTTSGPGQDQPLGRDGLSALVDVAGDVPVLALGGVTPETVAELLEAGAHGVAVMGGVMRAENPTAVVTRLLEQLPPAS